MKHPDPRGEALRALAIELQATSIERQTESRRLRQVAAQTRALSEQLIEECSKKRSTACAQAIHSLSTGKA